MRRALAFTFVFVLLAGIIGGLGYFQYIVKPNMIRGFISQAAPPPTTVAVAVAAEDRWTPTIPAIGTLRAVQGIDISPQVGGIVRAIQFESGQDVQKGAVLAQIDDAVEQADLASNTANLRNADFGLERQRQLIASNSTAKANVDQAQASRDQAGAAVDRSKSLIAQKQLVAPFAGRLGLRKVDPGQYVSPGTSLVTLQQLDPINVDFPVPEASIGVLKTGSEVNIQVDAFPGQVFKGQIKSVDARVDVNTRNVTVRAELANADRRLLPGMFANVSVVAGDQSRVVTVPRTAVTYSLYGNTIFVAKPAETPAQPGAAQAAAPADQIFTLEQRVVKTGDTRGDRIAIVDGLQSGERVVSEGQVKLQPNARVKINNASALPPPTAPRPKA